MYEGTVISGFGRNAVICQEGAIMVPERGGGVLEGKKKREVSAF